MNERDQELFEAELGRLKPGRPPEEFMSRLSAAKPVLPTERRAPSRPQPAATWRHFFDWLAPATAAAAMIAILLARQAPKPQEQAAGRPVPGPPAHTALKADDVEIDQRLVTSFDAVARMPDGAPVRFRCREWMDNVTLRDSKQGIEVERRTPRLEIVPVRLETY